MNEDTVLALEACVSLSLSIHHLNEFVAQRFGVSLVQFFVLQKIIHVPGISASMLAIKMQIHRSTLTQTLKRMERDALLFITNDPHDKRRHMIMATREGAEKFEFASKVFDAVPRNVLDSLDLLALAKQATEAIELLSKELAQGKGQIE